MRSGGNEVGERRSLSRAGAVVAALGLAACAGCAGQAMQVPGRVGPAPVAAQGRLIVHTEAVNEGDINSICAPKLADYVILDRDHREVRSVRGQCVTPEEVTLAPGDYTVHAQSIGMRTVDVDVRVVAGSRTEVYLDRGAPPPGARRSGAEEVRAADGSFVGWRASDAPR